MENKKSKIKDFVKDHKRGIIFVGCIVVGALIGMTASKLTDTVLIADSKDETEDTIIIENV